jgi:uncharacterized protein YndB with AHSA1/START domain
MTATSRSATNLTITREFDAPRDLVWRAWTEKEHIAHWFGPEGFTARVNENELRAGGRFDYVMIGPDGKEYPGVSIYKEVSPQDRLVATDDFGDEFKGGNADLPGPMLVTTTFEDVGTKTKVTISIEHASAGDKKKHEDMGVVAGWGSTLDKFERYVAGLNN